MTRTFLFHKLITGTVHFLSCDAMCVCSQYNFYPREMLDHSEVSLSKQHTACFLFCHGTQTRDALLCSISNEVWHRGQLHRHGLSFRLKSWISAVYEHHAQMTVHLKWSQLLCITSASFNEFSKNFSTKLYGTSISFGLYLCWSSVILHLQVYCTYVPYILRLGV